MNAMNRIEETTMISLQSLPATSTLSGDRKGSPLPSAWSLFSMGSEPTLNTTRRVSMKNNLCHDIDDPDA
jgi:hypothetical protein